MKSAELLYDLASASVCPFYRLMRLSPLGNNLKRLEGNKETYNKNLKVESNCETSIVGNRLVMRNSNGG